MQRIKLYMASIPPKKTKQPRLAFFRSGQAVTLPPDPLPYQIGVPMSIGSTLRDHLAMRDLVGNSGNMVHRMASVQMIECDRPASSQLNLFKLIKHYRSAERVAKMLDSRFDGLVITMSNVLRKDAIEPGMAELLREISIPVYCFGVGIQDSLPLGDGSSLHAGVLELMRVLDQKAAVFGVRGESTLQWLNSIGIQNAKVLGCPSLFAYPRNILSISESVQAQQNIIAAGHLGNLRRGTKLIGGLNGTHPSYVFQGELQAVMKDRLDEPGLYDEATQTVNVAMTSEAISNIYGLHSPFTKYYSFTDPSAWRQACLSHDVYVGDRIHGGVAAMQAGRPALVLYCDDRVQELVVFHGIPSCSLTEFETIGVLAAMEMYLSRTALERFRARYRETLADFERELRWAGLSLVNRLSAEVNH